MPNSRGFFGCISSDGVVYVADGHDKTKNALRSAYAYDIAASSTTPSKQAARAPGTAAAAEQAARALYCRLLNENGLV
uniref:Uncharacterized protein n=1 Tax=Oryza meridionalis TaxID=40149 RepID=A0A0E0EL45_9ORYZ